MLTQRFVPLVAPGIATSWQLDTSDRYVTFLQTPFRYARAVDELTLRRNHIVSLHGTSGTVRTESTVDMIRVHHDDRVHLFPNRVPTMFQHSWYKLVGSKPFCARCFLKRHELPMAFHTWRQNAAS